MQPSKSVRIDSVRAPLAIGWISCETEILSFGSSTMTGIFAAAPYAASAADVSPVEAQTMAGMS